MLQKEKIKIFVTETLGCECPEKVFEYIDSQHNIKLTNDILLNYKLNIGNRLLIYIVEVNDTKFIQSNLSKLVSIGKNERDKKGFNRFRLAIVTNKMDELRKIAHTIFENAKNRDKNIHLHLINSKFF